jgi:hypothetical protein
MKDNKPLLSMQELDALIAAWGDSSSPNSVDKFFPLRMIILLAVCIFAAIALLFFTDAIAARLTDSVEQINKYRAYIYFRGWFTLIITIIGASAYLTGRYAGITFGAIFVIATMNFISDLFTVYPEKLQNITPDFTLILLGRLIAIWFMFLAVKNVKRMPKHSQRLDFLLPFRRNL